MSHTGGINTAQINDSQINGTSLEGDAVVMVAWESSHISDSLFMDDGSPKEPDKGVSTFYVRPVNPDIRVYK